LSGSNADKAQFRQGGGGVGGNLSGWVPVPEDLDAAPRSRTTQCRSRWGNLSARCEIDPMFVSGRLWTARLSSSLSPSSRLRRDLGCL